MDIESMTPAAGSVPPSQRMDKKSGYSKGASPDAVFRALDRDEAMKEIAKLPPEERKAALSKFKQQQWERSVPYKH